MFAVIGIIFALLIASSLQKHIIFQKVTEAYRMGSAETDVPTNVDMDIRLSGRMLLPGKAVDRFLCVPVSIIVTPTGKLAFASRINASVSQQVGPLIDRAGIWSTIIDTGTLRSVEPGFQYIGMATRPALRIRYEDANFKKKRESVTVLSFATVDERDTARRIIEQDPQKLAEAAPKAAAAPAPPSSFPPPAAADSFPTPAISMAAAPVDPATSTSPGGFVESAQPLQPLLPYRASGKCTPAGVGILLIGALVVGSLVGVLYHFIAQYLDFPLISPLVVGALVGAIMGALIKPARCRNLAGFVAIAAFAGLVAYGARYVADSQATRPAMVSSFTRHFVQKGFTPSQAAAKVESRLDPITTLRIYMIYAASSGVVLTSTHSSSYNINTGGGAQTVGGTVVSGWGYWALFIAELLCAVFAAGAVAHSIFGSSVYCEQDRQWMVSTRLLNLAPRQVNQVLGIVNAQDWATLRRLTAQGAMNEQNYTRVTIECCPVCRSGTLHVDTNAGSGIKRLLHVTLAPEAVAMLSTVPQPVTTPTT